MTCDNCGGPEVRVPTVLIIWRVVNSMRICAKCHLRYEEIRRRRIEREQRDDLNTLYAETHRA